MRTDFTGYDQESYSITDDNGTPYPALIQRGCGCCATPVRITTATLKKAVEDAKEWLDFLSTLEPVDYPPECDGGIDGQ